MTYEPAPAGPPAGAPPSSNLVWAILTTLFCSLLGIVAIVFAAQVGGRWSAGDVAGAQRASRNARTWSIVAAVVGLVGGVIAVIYVVVVGATLGTSS